MVISVEAPGVDNAIFLDYLTSEVAHGERDIGSTDPIIPICNNCMDDGQYFGMPGGSWDSDEEGDDCHKCDDGP